MFYLPDSLDNHYATALKMQKWQTVSPGLPFRFCNIFFGKFFPDRLSGGLSDHFEDRFQGISPEDVIGHLIYVRRGGIKADACTRHFDHADVVLPISDCHRICQADAKTV